MVKDNAVPAGELNGRHASLSIYAMIGLLCVLVFMRDTMEPLEASGGFPSVTVVVLSLNA